MTKVIVFLFVFLLLTFDKMTESGDIQYVISGNLK